MKVGIFDSGIGGLTVLHEAMKIMPHETYLYVADTYHVPYGTKTKEVVHGFVENVAAFLDKMGIDVLVVACNTATSISVKALRRVYSFPVIGMEPAVKSALDLDSKKRVLVLATPLTLVEEKYHALIDRLDAVDRVDSLGMPQLVELAENKIFHGEEVTSYIKEALSSYDLTAYVAVVLGCTHFIYYREVIKGLLPAGVSVIDGNHGTINHLRNMMAACIETEPKGSISYYKTTKEGMKKTDFDDYMTFLNHQQ